jgi:hypothetical protein
MNWRPILVHLAWLTALAIAVEASAIGVCSQWFWTPLQRHYLPAFFWCSVPLIAPETVEVRWIWKTGRQGKHELATDDDTVTSEDGNGMALSQPSKDAGWKRLIEGMPQQVSSELLRAGLAGLAFDDEGLWGFLLLPEACGLVVLCYGLYGSVRLANRLIDWAVDFNSKRQRSPWEASLSNWAASLSELLDGFSAMVEELHSWLSKTLRSVARKLRAYRACAIKSIVQIEPSARQQSFPLPLFGVYSATGKGYLWSEKDEIG